MENPVLPSSCVTPAGTSIEVQNECEENTHTHNTMIAIDRSYDVLKQRMSQRSTARANSVAWMYSAISICALPTCSWRWLFLASASSRISWSLLDEGRESQFRQPPTKLLKRESVQRLRMRRSAQNELTTNAIKPKDVVPKPRHRDRTPRDVPKADAERSIGRRSNKDI